MQTIPQQHKEIIKSQLNQDGLVGWIRTAHTYFLIGILVKNTIGIITQNNNIINLYNSSNLESTGISFGYFADPPAYGNSISVNNNFFGGSTNYVYTLIVVYGTLNSTIIGNSANVIGVGTILECISNTNRMGGNSLISNNNFSNLTVEGFSGISTGSISLGALTDHHAIVSDNTFTNIITKDFSGIEIYDGNIECRNNLISNIISVADVVGISSFFHLDGSVHNIYENKINQINVDYGYVSGISCGAGSTITSANVYKNLISDISGTGTSTFYLQINGISVEPALNTHICNNLIANLSLNHANINGILINNSFGTSNVTIDYNTIYLNGSGISNFNSNGILHVGNSNASISNLKLKNNIVYNNCIATGSGSAVAYRRNSDISNYNPSSDNNLFYAGAPSLTQLIYTDGTNSFSNIADYKTFMNAIGADQNSVAGNVIFQSTVCSNPNFLKFNVSIPSKAESGGQNIPGVIDDFAGTIRFGNTGYAGTGNAPDIGAWELEGIPFSNSSISLSLKLYIQGYYTGNGFMDNNGAGGSLFYLNTTGAQPEDADTVYVSAMNASSPYVEVEMQKGLLKTNGLLTVSFSPQVLSGNSYYIRIRHRNSIETWSNVPVTMSSNTQYYFSDSQTQAFGANQVETFDQMGWAIYSGDINQDGAIDGGDFLELDPSIQNGDGGYTIGDLNGDGAVDGGDFLVLDPNIQNGIGAAIP